MNVDSSYDKPVTVGFISLGCAKNLVDSQVMAGIILSEQIKLAPSPEEADVVIVNTCAFIEEARNESYEMIESACALKRDGQCRAVIVAGCLPQRYRHEISSRLPDVDAFIGLDELEDIGSIIRRVAHGERGVFEVSRNAHRLYEPRMPGLTFTGGPYAYLKIAEGCDHRCSFCAIPSIRGSYRSRPMDLILKEAESLLARGVKELNLISQDVTRYGKDLGDGTDLPALIRKLAGLGGTFWIRLLYGHPAGVTDGLLSAMAETEKVCHYLDIPIQHSHPHILRAMSRRDTIDQVAGMAGRIRNFMPDTTLRTTCLIGFPGETDVHFAHLVELVKQVEFDHLGAFVYSPEENTPSFAMPDRPDVRVADERRNQLLAVQREIVDKKAAALIGKEAEVLLEKKAPGNNMWISRAKRNAPEVDGVVFAERLTGHGKPGDFVKVRYTAQDEYDMTAVEI